MGETSILFLDPGGVVGVEDHGYENVPSKATFCPLAGRAVGAALVLAPALHDWFKPGGGEVWRFSVWLDPPELRFWPDIGVEAGRASGGRRPTTGYDVAFTRLATIGCERSIWASVSAGWRLAWDYCSRRLGFAVT